MARFGLFLNSFVLILATLSCGGDGNTRVNPTVVGYVTNIGANTVTSFLLDENTGGLLKGSVAAAGIDPGYAAITVDKQYLFIGNIGGNISKFKLDGSGGMISAGADIPLLSANAHPAHLLISNDGRFLYVGTTVNAIEVFSIESSSGNLTPVQGSPFSAPSVTAELAMTRSGRYLYASSAASSSVFSYAVDQTTGRLTTLAIPAVDTGFPDPVGLAIDPSDSYLFVTASDGRTLLLYKIGTVGELQRIDSNIRPSAGTAIPVFTGNFVYMVGIYDNTIAGFRFDAGTGTITPVPGTPFEDGQSPSTAAVSPNGNILVVTRINPGHIATYRINRQTGALTSLSGNGFESGLEVNSSPNFPVLVPR